MIAPRDALRVILKTVKPLKPVEVPLARALGRCLARDVRADRDIPPADRSAMDGYAVRAEDLAGLPARLRLIGEVAAGSPARPRVRPGTCARILTGANVPPGADTVVMVEQTEERDGNVVIRKVPERGANIRRRGEEAPKGTVLLRKGSVLGARQIGTCAAMGQARVRVYGRPRVALVCTGAELRPAGARVAAHQERNSSGPALTAALRTWGFEKVSVGSAPDDLEKLTARLRKLAAGHDFLLLTAGVSMGRYDFVREAIENLGARVRFHGVAMKPGRPQLYATLPGDRPVFGLPGNPVSTMIGFYEFALPALRRMSGVPADECRPALHLPLGAPLTSKKGPLHFYLARLSWGARGPTVEKIRSMGSSDLVAGGRADGAMVVPGDVRELPAGAAVEFRPWRPLP